MDSSTSVQLPEHRAIDPLIGRYDPPQRYNRQKWRCAYRNANVPVNARTFYLFQREAIQGIKDWKNP